MSAAPSEQVTAGERPHPATIVGAIAVMSLVWGTTWFVLREGLEDLPPFGSAGVRFAIAWLAMVGLAPLIARREGGERPGARLVLAMGVLNFAVSYGVVYWCETRLPSALAAVLFAVYPLLIGVVGHLYVPGERLVGRQWAGLAFGLIGVGMLFATDLASLSIGGLGVSVGLLFLVSPLVSAFGTATVKRHGRGTSSALLNRDGMFLGAALLLLASLLFERDATWTWTPRAVSSLAYLSLVGTVLTFGLYFWALRHTRASTLSVIAFINPVVAVLVGWGFGDEPVTAWTWAGLATILAGVASTVRRGRVRGGGSG